LSLLKSGELQDIGERLLAPWYQRKAAQAEALLQDALKDVPCRFHVVEGSFFLWLWFPELPVSTVELYRRLREAGVLVIPGDSSFPGISGDWPHSRQCIRVSYAVSEAVLEKAAVIMGRVLGEIHAGGS